MLQITKKVQNKKCDLYQIELIKIWYQQCTTLKNYTKKYSYMAVRYATSTIAFHCWNAIKIQIEAQSNKHFFANIKCIWNWGGKLEFRKQIPPSLNLCYVSGISFKYSVRSLYSCSSAERREVNSRSNRLKNSKKVSWNNFEGKFRHIIMQRVKNNPRTIKYVEKEERVQLKF